MTIAHRASHWLRTAEATSLRLKAWGEQSRERTRKRQSVFVIALDGGMDAKQAAAVAMELVPNKMFGEA